jgi:hypothetical protein
MTEASYRRHIEILASDEFGGRAPGSPGEDLTLAYATDQVIWTRQQVPEISIEDSELVFVGYGINAPEREWTDYAGIDVQGKTVVILINDPGYATQDPELFNGNGMNNFGSTRDITIVGLGMSDLDNYLAAAAAAQERVVEGDREKSVAYGMEKAEEYIADHYHRVSDEYDLSWVVSGALEDMEMYFKTGLDIANSSD